MTLAKSFAGRTCAVVATLFLTLALVLPAQAQQGVPATPAASASPPPVVDAGPSFVIRPADGADGDYFTIRAKAGTTTDLTVVLGNAGDEPLELRTYVTDAVPMTNGGFGIATDEAAPTGTGRWIDYPAETLTFKPDEGIKRAFKITIPKDAKPGQYIAGLALQTAKPIEVKGSSLFNQIIRKAVAVFIIVPGPETPAFSLGDAELTTGGRIPRITIPVENSGNVLVKPRGELTLQNAKGETVFTAPVAMGSVYAGTTVPLSVGLRTTLPEGEYKLSVELKDEATGTSAKLQNAAIAIASAEQATSQFVLTGDVKLAPDAAKPVYADVSAEITNNGDPVNDAEVLLDVTKDGKVVETFPLVPTIVLPQGTTDVSQRYVPPTGWESGSWSFVLRLNVVDSSTNASTNVATLDTIPAINVNP